MERGNTKGVKRHLGVDFRTALGGLHTDIEGLHTDIDVNAERLRAEIRRLAEGVQGLRDELSPGFKAVHEELTELKALIRLSFTELDRRIQSL